MTAPDQFRQAIASVGLTIPNSIIPDGKLHRFASNGHPDDKAGWYVLFLDGVPAGSFGCWRTGLKESWCAKAEQHLTEAERLSHQHRTEQTQRLREEAEQRRHADAARRAQDLWAQAAPAPEAHPYLQRKKIQPHGLRADADQRLIVPVTIQGQITSLQFIDAGGEKKFLTGGAVKGGIYIMGDLTPATTLLLCEGFATGASLYEATQIPVVCAFSAGNLLAVAQAIRARDPSVTILLAGDHDHGGVGQAKAREAAEAVGGVVAVPDAVGTDWNDESVAQGPEAVRTAIRRALPPHVLDELHAFLGRFVSYPSEHAHIAHTLWVAHTHLMDCWESTPRLALLSPEPGSGKTRALELTGTLVPRPLEAVNMSAASLFRVVARPDGLPTILFDEIDTIFGPRAKEHEDVRGILNAGHRRGASVWRCTIKGKTIETEEFPCFSAVALAGLGNLPDTILSRSIIINMRRRAPGEEVQPYRRRLHAPEGHQLRDRLAAWTAQVRPIINLFPTMPQGVTDRPADLWESLLSVADAAGGDWPHLARVSCVTHVTLAMGEAPSLGVRLLADIQSIFGETDSLHTTDLLSSLVLLEETPWGDLKGKPLDARRLANVLKPYGVASKSVRIGGAVAKGYAKEDFFDAWLRYLPRESGVGASPLVTVTRVTHDTAAPNGQEVPSLIAATADTAVTPDQDEFRFDEEVPC